MVLLLALAAVAVIYGTQISRSKPRSFNAELDSLGQNLDAAQKKLQDATKTLERRTSYLEVMVDDKLTEIQKVERLEDLGLVIRVDLEARRAYLDEDGWALIGTAHNARTLLTKIIGLYARSPQGEHRTVNIYGIETGLLLSRISSKGDVEIIR